MDEHDSNISYTDGKKVRYYKSERDKQIKHHGYDNPLQWTDVLKRWDIDPKDIDAIGIVLDAYIYPWNEFILETDRNCEIDIPFFRDLGFTCPIYRVDHHYAHSLSSWVLGEEYDKSFVFDCFGDDFITHSLFSGSELRNTFTKQEAISLGELMYDFGAIYGMTGCGFDFAGKLMALKGYGNLTDYQVQAYKEQCREFDIKSLDKIWDRTTFKTLIDEQVYEYVRICHELTEDIFVNYFRDNCSKNERISYSGGVAQNTIINSRIKEVLPNLDVVPHCNDEGLSLGIVEFLRIQYGQERFDNSGYPYWQDDEAPTDIPSQKTIKTIAEELSNGKIVGWYQGNGEVGCRALGNRSILMNPTVKDGKDILNQRVKHREWYRPFGASILKDRVTDYFNWKGDSKYMMYVMDVYDKESFPSITHIDGTCRIQTVDEDLEIYYSLITEFEKLTGVPMLLNTSLNSGGKPIAAHVDDALEMLNSTELDILVVGNQIYGN